MSMLRCRRGLLPAVAVAVVLALCGSAPAQEGQKLYVLSVGCPGARNCPAEHLRPHKVEEARRFAAFFEEQKGKLFDGVVTRCLTGPEATGDNIRSALEDFQRRAQKGDRVIVLLNGHGGTDPRAGWVLETYDILDTGRPLVTADLRTTVGTLPARGIDVVVFVATCHAGALNLDGQGVVVLASCLAQEVSISISWTDHSGKVVESYSVFTRALLEGLRGKADANGDGIVTLVELERYVAERVPQLNAKLRPGTRESGRGRISQHVTCGRPRAIPSNLALVKLGPARTRPGTPARTIPVGTNPGR